MSISRSVAPARTTSARLTVVRSGLLGVALVLMACVHAAPTQAARLADGRDALRQAAAEAARLPRAPQITRAQLLQAPRFSDVQLAPDGLHLSFRRRDAEATGLYLRTLATGDERRLLADSEGVQAQWSGDGQRLWLADALGLAVFEVGSDTPRRLCKWKPQRHQQFWGAAAQAPTYALIREQVGIEGRRDYRYLRIDPDGRTQLLHHGAQALRELLLHPDGSLAFTHGYEGAQFDTVVRRHHAAGSDVVHRCSMVQRCRLLAHARDAAALYLLAGNAQGLLVLQRWQQGEKELQVLHQLPEQTTDASYPLWLAAQETWLAVAYHPDRRRWFGRDAKVDAQLAVLQSSLPGTSLELSTDRSGSRWLVAASRSDWAHDRHFLFLPGDGVLQPLLDESATDAGTAPALATTLAFDYRASDGMLLHAYVTLPAGVDAARAPLIALPHGGPYNRDRGGFDPLVQLLVNRGNVVLQPNFRGSTGYGTAYARAAGGEFGRGRVLQDIIEGLDALLAAGIGDAQHQALMGHSFGGYASLLGAVHHPDRFRVVVASAAPVDFGFSMRQIANEGGSGLPSDGPPAEILLPQYGMPFGDPDWHARMRSESPLLQVSRLRTPVYLWAGADDDRVALADIVRLVAEARSSGQTPVLLVDPDSGHVPTRKPTFEALLWLYEAAAHRTLGGALEAPSPPLQRLLDRHLRPAGAPSS